MILIFGGAYQGKLAFAQEKFQLSDEDVFFCRADSAPEFSAKIICNLENFCLYCLSNGLEPRELLRQNAGALRDKIVIARDISQGVVPVDPRQRAWREACGRALIYLAQEAGEVYRVFCGLPERLK